MVFNSFEFMIFFPIVVMVYLVIPRKIRYIWLLISSYYFYMSWNPKYAILIAASTMITYLSGIAIEKFRKKDKFVACKICLIISLVSNFAILAVFKYANFFISNISFVLSKFGFSIIDRRLDLILPVGISFYTFQTLSYSIDVYRGNIKAEKNIAKYALFVSFFPQLVAGPIERSENLLPQIQNVENIKAWNYENIRDGFFLMLWGLFQKIVIADRISMLVDTVINNYQNYGFVEISVAVFLFAIQIYCDFGGYTNIARGAARVMGFNLMNNFRQPYLAENIKDFWRRWHISLTSWFTDYLYIPLGGNRKGNLRKYINILIVFGVSGLWHGAGWNFVAWGLIHAIYQIVGDLKRRFLSKYYKKSNNCWSSRVRKIIVTFILVDFAWIFFACPGLNYALRVIKQMFTIPYTCGVQNLGIDQINLNLMNWSILILLAVDIIHEKGISLFAAINKQEIWFRWVLCLGLIWGIIMFGIYGFAYDPTTFIYFQF